MLNHPLKTVLLIGQQIQHLKWECACPMITAILAKSMFQDIAEILKIPTLFHVLNWEMKFQSYSSFPILLLTVCIGR